MRIHQAGAVQLRRSSRSTKGQAKQYQPPTMQGKQYSYAQAHLLDRDEDRNVECDPVVIGIIMMQLLLKAALKDKWDFEAHDAALKEQLHFRNTLQPVHWKDLTTEQCNMVLECTSYLS